MRTLRNTLVAAMLLGVALLAGCGGDEPAPRAGPVSAPDEADEGPLQPPAMRRGPDSQEAALVDVLERAKLVRVMRLDPGAECGTANCLEGNPVTASVVLTDEDAAWRATDLVHAWMAVSESVEPTCDAAYGHAVVLQGGGHEFVLLLDTGCGAYRLVVDGRQQSTGQVQPPDQIGVLEELLLAGELGGGLVDDSEAEPEAAEAGDGEDAAPADEPAPEEATEPTTDA
jgi:hypothetical protein